MEVSELIAKLKAMPPDAEVAGVYDGCARLGCEVVWLARSGQVLIGQADDVVYDPPDWPESVPRTGRAGEYWIPRKD